MLIGHLPAGYLMASVLKARMQQHISSARVLSCILLGTLAPSLAYTFHSPAARQPLFWLSILILSGLWLRIGRHGKTITLQVLLFSLGALLHALLAILADQAFALPAPTLGKALIGLELTLLIVALALGWLRSRAAPIRGFLLVAAIALLLLSIATLERPDESTSPSQQRPTPTTLIRSLQHQYPDHQVQHLYLPSSPTDTLEARLQDNNGKSMQLFITPHDGKNRPPSHAMLWREQLRELQQFTQQYPLTLAIILILGYAGGCLLLFRQRHLQTRAQLSAIPPQPTTTWLLAYASQSGQAAQVAQRSSKQFISAGLDSTCLTLNTLQAHHLERGGKILFVVSTYGDGNAPDNASLFARKVMSLPLSLGNLQFAILALGDRSYPNFCSFAHKLSHWLRHCGAHPLFDPVEVDNMDPGALRHWQQQLSTLGGHTAFNDWSTAHYRPWRLVGRTHLNPGSQGGDVYHLTLQPLAHHEGWRAGDIAEISPGNAPEQIAILLHDRGMDGEMLCVLDGQEHAFAHALGRYHLPHADELRGASADELLAALQPLPHREYSIASLPSSGVLELLVRQVRHGSGELGLGSGWLSKHAPLNSQIDLRIRHNSAFHLPDGSPPLLLIGNGTGLASLLALLREREQRAEQHNWLLFGERNQEQDFLFREQLLQWQEKGHLTHLDLAFSRDQPRPTYVQHLLREHAQRVRRWVEDGAAIYVCGSLEGMGQAVDDALLQILGADDLERLTLEGRYRRDLY